MRRPNFSILPALLAILVASPSGATQLAQVVDSAGTLLTLERGTYGELFPEGVEAAAEAQVLALDLVAGDDKQRLLVPTTATIWPEDSATLLYDPGAGITYLLWSAPFNGLHPMLYLTTFDGSSWGEVLEIVGTVFAPKMDLQLVVGHDSYTPPGGTAIDRTVIHVAWWEPRASGVEKQYAALVLENGRYVGRSPSRSLADFEDPSGEALFDQGPLAKALLLQAGQDHELVAGFHDPGLGEITSLQFEVLPLALSLLAAHVEQAATHWDPATGQSLMDVVHEALAEHGAAFHPMVLSLVAEGLAEILDGWQGDIESLAEKFGPRIIHIGMKVGSNGLVNPDADVILTIAPSEDEIVSPRHDLKVSTLGRWSVPEDLGDNPRLLLSRDGGDALLAWTASDDEVPQLIYRETLADGTWAEARSLTLSDDFSLDAAMLALAEHLRDR